MASAQSVSAKNLHHGDSVLLVVGKLDRWCDVEAMTTTEAGDLRLVVIPQGDDRSVALTLHPGDQVCVFRMPHRG